MSTCRRGWFCIIVVLACTDAPREEQPIASDSAAVTAPVQPLALLDSGAPKLVPFDSADPSFSAFRRQLLAALQRRDTAFLYSVLAPEIKNSFGGDDSIAGFKRIWRMSDPNTPVWSALTRVLNMGGSTDGSYFIAPYVYKAWPDSIDAFEHVAVTGAHAVARGLPSADAVALGALSYSILPIEEWQGVGEAGVATEHTWARLRLPDRREVWVAGLDVYSPVGWRAFFENRDGRWVLTLFVAGD